MNLQDKNYKIFGIKECMKLLNNVDWTTQVKMKSILKKDLRGNV